MQIILTYLIGHNNPSNGFRPAVAFIGYLLLREFQALHLTRI